MLKQISKSDSLAMNRILTQWSFDCSLCITVNLAKPEEIKAWRQRWRQCNAFYVREILRFTNRQVQQQLEAGGPVLGLSRNRRYFVAIPHTVAVFSEEL